jgi:mannose-6-phosphate isomerase-like protein (cupin superfamily)
MILFGATLVALASAGGAVRAVDQGPIAFWSAEDLVSGRAANLPLVTVTHAYGVIRLQPSAERPPESHEGVSDVLFVVAGGGTVVAGGAMESGAPLPGMPGEMRGRAMKGGQTYQLAAGAVIDIPPSTPYQMHAGSSGLTAMRLKINAGMHPWSIVSTQQFTLAPTPTHPAHDTPVNAESHEVWYWSADRLLGAHRSLSAAADRGQPFNDPRDFVPIPATRTHAYNYLHRRMGASNQPPGVEFHGANTDIYFMLAGTGTLMTEGTIEHREPIPNRPGEERGTLITLGRPFKVKAGDVINMPPNTPHQSLPDPVGFSYMLIKVNVGSYPWSLIEK